MRPQNPPQVSKPEPPPETVLAICPLLVPFGLASGPGYPTQAEIAWTPPAEMAAERRERLGRLVRDRLGARARRVTCKVVTGEALPTILAAARTADSIVMATLGRTGLAHLLIGSVAEKVVRHAAVPVLTLRPPPRRSRQKATRRVARR